MMHSLFFLLGFAIGFVLCEQMYLDKEREFCL